HTREDHPGMSDEWRQRNLVCVVDGDGVAVSQQPIPTMPDQLLALFERSELEKYFTEAELAGLPEES
ncbi:MAG: fumarate reductase/succinate dehydrogenase flavoprotein subunit, partial [Actinomycetota bacterium]|nr:fumarate reductase/succinate dehydrogenase flavoprotein subunit [Actinomycetota bacterium]